MSHVCGRAVWSSRRFQTAEIGEEATDLFKDVTARK